MKAFATLAVVAALAAAAPAQADLSRQERNRIIAGAVLLGIIGLAIDAENDARAAVPAGLPGGCLSRQHTAHGAVDLFDAGCLEATFAGAAQLPFDCAVTVRQGSRVTAAYDAQCLLGRGYRIAGH